MHSPQSADEIFNQAVALAKQEQEKTKNPENAEKPQLKPIVHFLHGLLKYKIPLRLSSYTQEQRQEIAETGIALEEAASLPPLRHQQYVLMDANKELLYIRMMNDTHEASGTINLYYIPNNSDVTNSAILTIAKHNDIFDYEIENSMSPEIHARCVALKNQCHPLKTPQP